MKCDFVVGDKVVCIDDFEPCRQSEVEQLPKLNEIYTVQEVIEADGEIWITLVEIQNQIVRIDSFTIEDYSFLHTCFRKVQKHKTDISVFTAMLNKTPAQNKKELENA
jgi:hypothetical protein